MSGERTRKSLWRCPKCGHRFTAKNMSHSCGRYSLNTHFRGKPLNLRRTFAELVRVSRSCGPVTVYAQKTRIVLQQRVRFAGAVVRSDWLDVHLWLRRAVRHPRLFRNESLGQLGYACHFKLRDPGEIDDALKDLVQEAYSLGKQGS